MLRTNGEPSSPVQKVWKPELYKIQLEAPTPKTLKCLRPLKKPDELAIKCYGTDDFHGEMGHLEAEQLLNNCQDGTYLIRKSPNAKYYYTLSVRFNNRTKHYKICYKLGEGHYLQDQMKRFESVYDLVADGLVTFYMQLHAAPIIQQINEQTKSCYQQSPYMTLNRRKLRALSNELRKSLGTKNLEQELKIPNDIDGKKKSNEVKEKPKNGQQNNNESLNSSKDSDTDLILPSVYEKAHRFKIHNFKGLNWCEFCANFLWGFTAQGVKCEACGFVAHSKCSELVPPKCVPDLKRIRGVFGTDLTTMVQLHNCSIPFVVRRCVEEVEARGMLQEGIYRVSGFADEIDALKLALDRDGDKTDMSEAAYGNVNVIAGTLKLYLRLLPVPLITFQAYPHFMEASREVDPLEQIKKMQDAVKHLPLAHYDCLQFMIEHLKRVASHYAVNKMNEHNLATVFAPTLIATPQHLINLTEEIFMLSFLISSFERIFEQK